MLHIQNLGFYSFLGLQHTDFGRAKLWLLVSGTYDDAIKNSRMIIGKLHPTPPSTFPQLQSKMRL